MDASKVKPRILTLTQSTYDGVLYNTETIKHALDGYIDTLHFDEAWLPHAAFHTFYGQFHAMGKKRPRPKDQLVFATQSTHKLLAGLSQASQVLVQDAQNRKLDRHLFNEAYLMHTSTSPQYAIIASCDVAAAMMEAPGGTALVEESIAEALDFRRAMRKVDKEYGRDWWFKVWGPDKLAAEGIGRPTTGCSRPTTSGTASATWRPASTCSTRSRARSSRRGWTCRASSPRPAFRRPSSPSTWPSTASWSRRPGLYSFFIMFTIGITKGRWNTLLTALAAVQGRLRQERADVARAARVLRRAPALRSASGLRDLCQSIHDMYAKGDIARLVTEMYLSDLQPAMKPSDAFARIAHRETERVTIDALEGRITTSLLTPYPPGIPLLIPGERFNRKIVDFLRFTRAVQRRVPRLRHRRARPGRGRRRRRRAPLLRRLRAPERWLRRASGCAGCRRRRPAPPG